MKAIDSFAKSLWATMLITLLTVSVSFSQTTYNITTIVGTGTGGNGLVTNPLKAQFNAPNGIDVDSQGNIYICDLTNKRIRKIDIATNLVSTIAGTDQPNTFTEGMLAKDAPLGVPGALAVASNGDVYIAESDKGRVLRIDASDNKIYRFAGSDTPTNTGKALDAGLVTPIAIEFDSQDNVYIVDRAGIVYKVDTNDNISNFAGGGGSTADNILATNAKLTFPVGISVDASDRIYIADRTRNRIFRVEDDTLSTFPVGLPMSKPRQVEVDASGDVYISDMGNQRILKVTNGGSTSVFAGTGGTFQDNVLATDTKLFNPRDITLDANGDLLIADRQHHRIRQVKNGIINTIAGDGTAGYLEGAIASQSQLNEPGGVSLSSNNELLYIADGINNLIVKVDLTTGIMSDAAGIRHKTGGFNQDNILSTGALLNVAGGVEVAANGDVYIADSHNHRVRRINASDGKIITFAGDGNTTDTDPGDNGLATDAQLNVPIGIALDNNGSVYIADRNQNRIRRVKNGTITTIAGDGTAGFNGDNILADGARLNKAVGIAIDANGVIYIGDRNNLVVRKIENDTIKIIAGSTIQEGGSTPDIGRPRQVAVDGDGNVFFADLDNNLIRRIDASTGAVTTIAGGGSDATGENILATNAALNEPRDIAIATDGKIYIADRANHRIRVLTPNASSRITQTNVRVQPVTPALVYPNPASQQVTIQQKEAQQIVLIDMQGNQVGNVKTNNGQAQLKLENLKNGVYFIRILGEQGKLLTTKTLLVNR